MLMNVLQTIIAVQLSTIQIRCELLDSIPPWIHTIGHWMILEHFIDIINDIFSEYVHWENMLNEDEIFDTYEWIQFGLFFFGVEFHLGCIERLTQQPYDNNKYDPMKSPNSQTETTNQRDNDSKTDLADDENGKLFVDAGADKTMN